MHIGILIAIIIICMILGFIAYKYLPFHLNVTVSKDPSHAFLTRKNVKSGKSYHERSFPSPSTPFVDVKGKKASYIDASVKNDKQILVGYNIFVKAVKKNLLNIRIPTKVSVYDFFLDKSKFAKDILGSKDVDNFNSDALGEDDGKKHDKKKDCGYKIKFDGEDVKIVFQRTNSNPELHVTVSPKRLESYLK